MEITRAELKTLDGLLRATGRTMQKSAVILPPRERTVFSVAYLLCRAADTVVDTAVIAPERKIFRIEKFAGVIDKDGAEKIAAEVHEGRDLDEKLLLQNLPFCISIFDKFEPEDRQITRAVVGKVCGGMMVDLQTFKPGVMTALKTAEDLENYCGMMGGAPGVFWSELILSSAKIEMPAEEFKKLGKNIGDALQIVNVLRDIREDILNNRCYLPESDLKLFGVSVDDLKASDYRAAIPAITKWLLWGLDKISAAPEYFNQIPKRAWRFRLSVLMPVIWALDTFELLAHTDILANRVKINKKNIYGTILKSPLYLFSNKNFASAVRQKTEAIKELLIK